MCLSYLKMLMQQPIPIVFNNLQHPSPRRPPPGTPRQTAAKKSQQQGLTGMKHYCSTLLPSPRQFLRDPCGTAAQVTHCFVVSILPPSWLLDTCLLCPPCPWSMERTKPHISSVLVLFCSFHYKICHSTVKINPKQPKSIKPWGPLEPFW